MKSCSNGRVENKTVEDDEDVRKYFSCSECDGGEYSLAELNAEARVPCETCNDEGTVEVGPECDRPMNECCGGCYRTLRCLECSENQDDY